MKSFRKTLTFTVPLLDPGDATVVITNKYGTTDPQPFTIPGGDSGDSGDSGGWSSAIAPNHDAELGSGRRRDGLPGVSRAR